MNKPRVWSLWIVSFLVGLRTYQHTLVNETHGRFQIGQHLPDIKNGLKLGDALTLLVFIFALEYAIKRVQAKQEVLKLSGTHQLMVYADGDNLLGQSTHTIKKNAENLLVSSKKIALEINSEKIKYTCVTLTDCRKILQHENRLKILRKCGAF